MAHIKITEIDAILSRVDLKGIQILAPILTYQDTIWKAGPYAKKKIDILKKCYKSSRGKEALFLTGFIPRIKMYLESIGYTYEIIKLTEVEIGLRGRYRLKNRITKKEIEFRPDQLTLIDEAFKSKRGMIKAPTGCLVGSTKIRLLDGTVQPIQNLVGKKDFYVLSSYKSKIVPGKVKRVWKTKTATNLVRVTLDDGTFIDCTPEHPFLLKSGLYKPAFELIPFDSLMPFTIIDRKKEEFKNRNSSVGYNYIYNSNTNKYEKLAYRISPKPKSNESMNLHHIDGNKKNDTPENLEWISVSNHISFHLKEYHKTNDGRKRHLKNDSKIQKERSWKAWHNDDGSLKEERVLIEREKILKLNLNPEVQLHQKKCKILKNIKKLLKYCSATFIIFNFNESLNIARSNGEKYLPIKRNCIKYFGNLCTAVEAAENYNHHVKSVKLIKRITPVYDMEVEKYHNFGVETSKGKGVFVHNSGKSILIMGVISNFVQEENILVLCHSTGIVKQLADECACYFSGVVMFGGDVDPTLKFQPLTDRIVFSTVQSFSSILPQNYCDYFSCVIVDEAHRISAFQGAYANILQNLLAPYRFGFTATLPTKLESQFAYEGLIGPLIAELSINQAAELDILAKPKIKIIKAGFPSHIRDLRDYHSVVQEGIVENETRNRQIVSIMRDIVAKNETVLVFIGKIKHGEILERICFDEGVPVKFVQGASTMDIREQVKNELNRGTTNAVITSTIWQQGVNIPNLHNIIIAAGGKSEIATLQAIGRGLRKTTSKNQVMIYDFFDGSHPYLVSHFGERISLYCSLDWL